MKYIGIDVAKLSFDVYYEVDGKPFSAHLSQDTKAYHALCKHLSSEDIVVMEATGTYHVKLAHYLLAQGYKVVVVNPKKIAHFAKMNLQRSKTDKQDAKMIYSYGVSHSRSCERLWQPLPKEIIEIKQCLKAIETFEKQKRQLKNQLEALSHCHHCSKDVLRGLNQSLKAIDKQLDKLIESIGSLVESNAHYRHQLSLVESVVGIGRKTALMLLCLTECFERFTDARTFLSYIGMSPRIYESGSSVKQKSYISKVGNANIRQLLYLCSWSAKRHNRACSCLYERLSEARKPAKVINVAIAHKLLRQVFGVIKHQQPFNPQCA